MLAIGYALPPSRGSATVDESLSFLLDMARREKRSEWQFHIIGDEHWLWEVRHADGRVERASTLFATLSAAADDAKKNGWAAWPSDERRHVKSGRDPLESLPTGDAHA